MQSLRRPLASVIAIAIIGIFVSTLVPRTARGAGSAPVTVVNTTPVPVTGTVTGNITGSVSINNEPAVHAIQSGAWTVNLGQGVEKLDTANGHLSNIENSVGQMQFDQVGSLYTTLRGPIQTTAPTITKSFQTAYLRLD